MDKYVVVMYWLARPGQELPISDQINEVFGPFDSEDEASEFVTKADEKMPEWNWLITPMANPLAIMGTS